MKGFFFFSLSHFDKRVRFAPRQKDEMGEK